MQVPLEIRFHDVDRSPASEALIRELAERLERFATRLIACRVTVSMPHRSQHKGRAFHVRVEVTLPGHKDLVAVAEPREVQTRVELNSVIREAFEAVERQVVRVEQERRHEVKNHTRAEQGEEGEERP